MDFNDKDRRRDRYNRRKKSKRPNFKSVKPWRGSNGPTEWNYDNYREHRDNSDDKFSVDNYDDNE